MKKSKSLGELTDRETIPAKPVPGGAVKPTKVHPLEEFLSQRLFKRSIDKMYCITIKVNKASSEKERWKKTYAYAKYFMKSNEDVKDFTFMVETEPITHLHGFFYSRTKILASSFMNPNEGIHCWITSKPDEGWLSYIHKESDIEKKVYIIDRMWQKELKKNLLLEGNKIF